MFFWKDEKNVLISKKWGGRPALPKVLSFLSVTNTDIDVRNAAIDSKIAVYCGICDTDGTVLIARTKQHF